MHTMRTPTTQFESFSRRAIAAALLSVPLATRPAVAFDNALPGREARAAAKKTPGPSPAGKKDTLDRSACNSFWSPTRLLRALAKRGLAALTSDAQHDQALWPTAAHRQRRLRMLGPGARPRVQGLGASEESPAGVETGSPRAVRDK